MHMSAWVGGTLLGSWVAVPAPTPALLPIRQAAGFAGGNEKKVEDPPPPLED